MRTSAKIIILSALSAAALGCEKSYQPSSDAYIGDETPLENLSHEMIVLGEKLEDPYSVENITKALGNLYPTKASRIEVKPTNLYVRFLPESQAQYDALEGLGVELADHPLDYRIIREGDYYHDPEIEEDDITWQYAVVDKDFDFPDGIRCEILDRCYISENDPSTRGLADGINWDAVEEEAYRITGNRDLYEPPTKGGATAPEGRITLCDSEYAGGKPVGLAGVKVVCNSFIKIATAYTDRDGYYKMSRKYASKPRYRIVFRNKAGFDIGFNLILLPASMSTLGKGPSSGLDVVIDENSDKKLFQRSVVSNAAYEYFSRCTEEDMNILPPSKRLRIWLMGGLSASSTPMLHHGAYIDNSTLGKYLGTLSALLKVFLPDVTLGTREAQSYRDLYLETVHELSHASHFAKVGKGFWDRYIKYILNSFIASGFEAYGDGSVENFGYCEVGEMWAYYMQNKLCNERYGGAMSLYGTSYWFHPQILSYLDERGLSRSKLFKALDPDVTSRELLRDRLISLYPEKSTIISQAFERYAN